MARRPSVAPMEAEDLSEMMNSIDMDEGGVAETIETEVAEAEVDMASGFVPDFFEPCFVCQIDDESGELSIAASEYSNWQEDGVAKPYPPIAAEVRIPEETFKDILRVFRAYDTDGDGLLKIGDYDEAFQEKVKALYESFQLSSETGDAVSAGEFIQAVTYRAITLVLDRPWAAVRLVDDSAVPSGDLDADLAAGHLEIGQSIGKWMDQLTLTLNTAVAEALTHWGGVPPPSAANEEGQSARQALAPIPRDDGHRMLLFVHDYPQSRGLAAARDLLGVHSESPGVLRAWYNLAGVDKDDDVDPSRLHFETVVYDRTFSRPFVLPGSKAVCFPGLAQPAANEGDASPAITAPPLRFWLELLVRQIWDASGQEALNISTNLVEALLGGDNEAQPDTRRPRTVSAGDVETIGGPVVFPRDSVLKIAALFRELDKNGDGHLTNRDFELLLPGEAAEFQKGQFGLLLEVFDRDNDTEITFEEFVKKFREMALSAKLDTPKFGPITNLLTTFEERIRKLINEWTAELSRGYFEYEPDPNRLHVSDPEWLEWATSDEVVGGWVVGSVYIKASLRVTIDEIFDRFDTSQNGILEEDDFRPYGAEALQIFERLQSIYDTDQDGVITRQEFHTVMEREALATKLSLNEGTLEEQILEIQQAVDRTVFSLCQQLEGLWGGSID